MLLILFTKLTDSYKETISLIYIYNTSSRHDSSIWVTCNNMQPLVRTNALLVSQNSKTDPRSIFIALFSNLLNEIPLGSDLFPLDLLVINKVFKLWCALYPFYLKIMIFAYRLSSLFLVFQWTFCCFNTHSTRSETLKNTSYRVCDRFKLSRIRIKPHRQYEGHSGGSPSTVDG